MCKKHLFLLGCLSIAFNAPLAQAQEPPQVVLQRFDLPNTDYQHNGMSLITYAPHDLKPRHQHTGPEVGFVLAGEITIKLEGHPAQHYHAGESFQIPVDTYHTTEAGPHGAKVLATWMLKN